MNIKDKTRLQQFINKKENKTKITLRAVKNINTNKSLHQYVTYHLISVSQTIHLQTKNNTLKLKDWPGFKDRLARTED